jgi:hypothetical protein
LWPVFQHDEQVGRETLKRYSRGAEREGGSLAEALGLEGLADLYIWMRKNFPPDRDPVRTKRGAHEVTAEHSVAWLRDDILGWIRNRGTKQSVEQARRILAAYPAAIDLQYAARGAEEACRERIGERHEIEDILAFGPVRVIRRRVFRAFIASSSDVARERAEFRECCRRLNQSLVRRGLEIEPYSYEHEATAAVHEDGPQGVIQPDLELSHIVVFVIGSRVGEGTKKEISWALHSRKRRGRPRILVYALDAAKRAGNPLGWEIADRVIASFQEHAVVTSYSDPGAWSSHVLQRDLEREVLALDDLIPK